MGFDEVQFPVDISYGSEGGPEFLTDIAVTAGGHERRNVKWSSPRTRYQVSYGVRSATQLATLLAFFRARQGKAHGFRFRDWTDYSALAVYLGDGDGVTQDFQLKKTYHSGATESERIITKPIVGSERIYLDGVELLSGFSVDGTNGMLHFDVAPSAAVVITVDFEFDVPVRFDTDYLSVRMEDYGVNSLANIPLVEVRI